MLVCILGFQVFASKHFIFQSIALSETQNLHHNSIPFELSSSISKGHPLSNNGQYLYKEAKKNMQTINYEEARKLLIRAKLFYLSEQLYYDLAECNLALTRYEGCWKNLKRDN